MNCSKCGSSNPENATFCAACGATLANPYATPQSMSGVPGVTINNWLIPAIITTVCCCPPFGIVSIVYAAQVNGKLAGGDVAGAQQSANNAKMWFWIAFGLGLTFQLLYLGLVIVGGGLAALQEQQGGGF